MIPKKENLLILLIANGLLLLYSCKSRQRVSFENENLQERIFAVNILPGDQKLNTYLDYHKHVWPEVEAGFKKAGYRKITLSRFQNLVVMSVVVPAGANLDSMSKVASSYDKKCAEWNQLMDSFQAGVDGAQPGQKWVEVNSFYEFKSE